MSAWLWDRLRPEKEIGWIHPNSVGFLASSEAFPAMRWAIFTRLIAHVVTGKLDVREAPANLPDEPEEPEQIEDSDATG